MFHMRIEVGYSFDNQIKTLAEKEPHKLNAIRAACPDFKIPEGDVSGYTLGWREREFLMVPEQLEVLSDNGIEYQVKRFVGQMKPTAGQEKHHHIHIALPGIGMLMIDEVTVEYDVCTDDLQRRLNDGWRILAVCPPVDARRPDYVLGRSQALHDHNGRR